MTNLDVNTPNGQQSLADELQAVEIFQDHYPHWGYIHTDKTGMSKVDGILTKSGQLSGLALTKCRYDCHLSTFELQWNWEWLLTWRTQAIGALLARHIQTPLFGFVYIVEDKLLLVKKLFDPATGWTAQFRIERSWTRATCNGGLANRVNSYIKIDKAKQLRPK